MEKKTSFFIYTMLLMGVFLVFASGCKKDDNIPVLTTTAVTDIKQTTAISGGNITSDGGATVTACGICWNTTGNPTVEDNKTTDGLVTGNFTGELTGLTVGTTYYVCAYATNSQGTAYGNTLTFETLGNTFTDSRDGNVYKMVTIGDQIWMAENLRYLPSVIGIGTGSYSTSYYYVYGYDGTDVNAAKATANYTTYGVLYNWPAACSSCPTGWHLPSNADWTELTDYLGENAGGKLKATGTIEAGTGLWHAPNTGATNVTGFIALPGGNCTPGGTFYDVGSVGIWWSATEFTPSLACYILTLDYASYVNRFYVDKDMGASVRCVKD